MWLLCCDCCVCRGFGCYLFWVRCDHGSYCYGCGCSCYGCCDVVAAVGAVAGDVVAPVGAVAACMCQDLCVFVFLSLSLYIYTFKRMRMCAFKNIHYICTLAHVSCFSSSLVLFTYLSVGLFIRVFCDTQRLAALHRLDARLRATTCCAIEPFAHAHLRTNIRTHSRRLHLLTAGPRCAIMKRSFRIQRLP